MKNIIAAVAISATALLPGAAVWLAGNAHAYTGEYSWVADDSADICNILLLGGDWINLGISTLQLEHDITRAEAVTGMQQAAVGYCPKYAANAPTH